MKAQQELTTILKEVIRLEHARPDLPYLVFNGYLQGLSRAAGLIAQLHHIPLEDLEKLDQALRQQPQTPAKPISLGPPCS